MKATIQLHEWIFGDAPCRNGRAMWIGRIVEVREKAVKVDYAIEPVTAGGGSAITIFYKQTWIPRSVIHNNASGALEIKAWFLAKGLERTWHIKHYYIGEDNTPKYLTR